MKIWQPQQQQLFRKRRADFGNISGNTIFCTLAQVDILQAAQQAQMQSDRAITPPIFDVAISNLIVRLPSPPPTKSTWIR